MRERTPSADDTPKRAPPAPCREATSADVAGGSKTINGTVEVFRTAKLSPTSTLVTTSTTSITTTTTTTTNTTSTSSNDIRMVASAHNLEDIGMSHPISATNDRQQQQQQHQQPQQQQQQQQQEKHTHAYKSAQTAQDKRSRLSNVINNLRKKVPEARSSGDSSKKEEDDRNSIERNLETLEKYVMTVLNGVIKDEEDDDREIGRKTSVEITEKNNVTDKLHQDEDLKGPSVTFEPSKPNESRTEAAVLVEPENTMSISPTSSDLPRNDRPSDNHENQQAWDDETSTSKYDESKNSVKTTDENVQDISTNIYTSLADGDSQQFRKSESTTDNTEESRNKKSTSKETKSTESYASQGTLRVNDSQEICEEKKENRSLGTIIMERLSDHQTIEERIHVEKDKDDPCEFTPENATELRNICRDVLNDLLSGTNQLIDENSRENEEGGRTSECSDESTRDSSRTCQELSMTSLHCSLPLDKVASVLQNCQTTETVVAQSPMSPTSTGTQCLVKSPSKPPSPTVRHLCLYCDRKFLSISLRQRHTERAHQIGGGRRSERNSRKSSQSCQYCSDKCAESLEGLFQHMVGNHGDKYHACVQCSTRYLTREALVGHMSENHGANLERSPQLQDKLKESTACKELAGNQSPRDKTEAQIPKERRAEEPEIEYRAEATLLKPIATVTKDTFSNPGSPEFDSSFYSSVSCNIRENLLHHLDGKLQTTSTSTATTSSTIETKPQPQPQQQQQSFYEHNVNQIQFPIDISLTAATPVYTKEYTSEEYENSSEYAQKPGKSNRSHPRRVSFEKYNFPRKYDGKEQWTCSIKDLSKFDISTQLTLRKKQQLLKDRVNPVRHHNHQHAGLSELQVNDVVQTNIECEQKNVTSQEQILTGGKVEDTSTVGSNADVVTNEHQSSRCDTTKSSYETLEKSEGTDSKTLGQIQSIASTEFSIEFGNFLRLRKWDENLGENAKAQEIVYAELTGEWSRPRIYICGACASRHVTLREMEDHKASTHPNVWCSHFEFSGDQRELYKHLFLPGRSVPTAKARNAILPEMICTKCSKNCTTLPEFHRHMLECGGDQAWLLGLFGNGKKKCKWRPFGSRSRRRRQRGMKRNIQNSQTPRVNVPKEKQPTGPRVRPSDRESIQKMLANLPPKRATRKVLQDSSMRAQGRLRNVQTRSRPRMVGDNSTASRMSRNKAVLRNKLLKNAKSIQRNRCRSDNISAVIESVVNNYNIEPRKFSENINTVLEMNEKPDDKETKEKNIEINGKEKSVDENEEKSNNRGKITRGPRVLGKKKNVRTKDDTVKSIEQTKREKMLLVKTKGKPMTKSLPETKADVNETVKMNTSKGTKGSPKENDIIKSNGNSPDTKASSSLSSKNKSPAQTTPKRKRPVDPVASLHASIKAKSQLRTQDGKFARDPSKDYPTEKTFLDILATLHGRRLVKMVSNNTENNQETSTRSKLRTVNSRGKSNDVQTQKRTTRLSSDSDKMPTLEPAVQIPANDEYVDTTTNDLPILSPVAPSSNISEQKVLRGTVKSSGNNSKNPDIVERENSTSPRKNSSNEDEEKSDITQSNKDNSTDKQEKEEKKVPKGRRPKNDVKHIEQKDMENVEVDVSVKDNQKNSPKEGKAKTRKGAPTKHVNSEEDLKEDVKKIKGITVDVKKESKQRKEDTTTKTFETRSNSRARLEKFSDSIIEDTIKIQNVPFEVKKLIGSDSKEDLLTKLGLTSRDASSKRMLRQSTPRSKAVQMKNKTPKETEPEKSTSFDATTNSEISKVTMKKEKTDARRKSPRTIEKKLNVEKEKVTSKEEKLTYEDPGKSLRTVMRGRRSNSLSNESKSGTVNTSRISSLERVKTEKDNHNKSESATGTTQSNEEENTSNKRQTRGSLLNMSSESDAMPSKETSREANDTTAKKNTSLGKRRGRIKSSNEIPDKKNTITLTEKKLTFHDEKKILTVECEKKITGDISDKIDDPEKDGTSTKILEKSTEINAIDDKHDSLHQEKEEIPTENEEEKNNVMLTNKIVEKFNETDGSSSEDRIDLVNLSLTHLQVETSNSLDSGKENSLETSVSVQKLKVGRPKKSWGSRRERTSKRSLSNVIGILTEGMNIPVEAQQSVVLTVQTTLDNVNPDSVLHNNAQQPSDSNVPATRTISLETRNEKSPENDIANFEVTAAGENRASEEEVEEEKAHSCTQKNTEKEEKQRTSDVPLKNYNENISTDQKEQTSNISNVKAQSPTNDIILDLSRRKPKGKGSFLEKIVSKIAKQKDALLEGEVGSLLDTAADELTSILDEVNPPENPENPIEVKNSKCKNKTNECQSSNKSANSTVEKRDSSNDMEACKEIKEDNVDSRKNPETSTCLNESIETHSIDERKLDTCNEELMQSSMQEDKSTFVETNANDNTDKFVTEIQKNETVCDSTTHERIPTIEAHDLPNGTRLPILPTIVDTTMSDYTSTKEDNAENSGKTLDDTRSKWKSKKRSLEENSPKKSKRKSIEVTESTEENLVPEELQLSDIMKLIDKSEQSSFDEKSSEKQASYLETEKVQPGKRKSINDNSEITDLTSYTKIVPVQSNGYRQTESNRTDKTSEDTVDGAKKLKVEEKTNTSKFVDKEDQISKEKIHENIGDGEDFTGNTSNKNDNENMNVQNEMEENSKLQVKIAGKRKSCNENTEHFTETDAQLRRSSKRRSLPEERSYDSSLEQSFCKSDTSIIVDQKDPQDFTLTCDTSRKRSSRTRSLPVESKNDEDTCKDEPKAESNNIDERLENTNTSIERVTKSLTKKNIPPVQTTILRVPEISKIFERTSNIDPKKIDNNKEVRNEATCPAIDLNQSERHPPAIIIPKVPKKRGRKKKCLINEHLPLNDPIPPGNTSTNEADRTELTINDKVTGRKSTRITRTIDAEDLSKSANNSLGSPHVSTQSTAHFKIPEVTEVLQHTKKRTSKRKSVPIDENVETVSNFTFTESETSNIDVADVKTSFSEKDQVETTENTCEESTLTLENQNGLSKKCTRDQTERIERPSSSSSVDLSVASTRTRSSKRRKQLSSEDLSTDGIVLNYRAESVDNLSEASCTSEFSYFRRKRFSKRKKGFDESTDDVQTDTSVTDSESVDTEKTCDRRQSLKRKAKKNISFVDEHYDLVDDFDVSIDIRDCLENTDTFDNIESHLKSNLENKPEDEIVPSDETLADEKKEDNETEDTSETKVLSMEESSIQEAQDEGDNHQTSQEDFQTPKKRAAGNFVVVHTKTGEILIVEKRKKLTKEAARFFCDVCATSFTRKSSLKKHNLSQSHLLQLAKSNKEKGCVDSSENSVENVEEETEDSTWKSETSQQNETNTEEKDRTYESTEQMNEETLETNSEITEIRSENSSENVASTNMNESYAPYTVSMESTGSLIDPRVTRQDTLEDELLDEEICKITENMSHDEYVLTDHISPVQPESSSTPIKAVNKKTEDTTKKKKSTEKKKEKNKKNLADEHLTLDTPEPEKSTDPVITDSNEISTVSTKLQETILQEGAQNLQENTVVQDVESRNNLSETKENECVEEMYTSKFSPSNESKEKTLETRVENATFSDVNRNEDEHVIEKDDSTEKNEKINSKEFEYSDNEVLSKCEREKPEGEDPTEHISKNETISEEDRALCERFSLRFTINKRNLEHSKESDTTSGKCLELNRSDILECTNNDKTQEISNNSDNKPNNLESFNNDDRMQIESTDDASHLIPETHPIANVELHLNPESIDNRDTSINNIDNLTNSGESENNQKEATTSQDFIYQKYDLGDQNPPKSQDFKNEDCSTFEVSVNESVEFTKKLDDEESFKTSGQHGKSRKQKSKKHTEGFEKCTTRDSSFWSDDRGAWKRSKRNQNKTNHDEITACLETRERTSIELEEKEDPENIVRLSAVDVNNIRHGHKSRTMESTENTLEVNLDDSTGKRELEYKFNKPEIADVLERQKVCWGFRASSTNEISSSSVRIEHKEETLVKSCEETNREPRSHVETSQNHEDKITSDFTSVTVDDGEASSSSSSFASDKPLAELLSRVETKPETNAENVSSHELPTASSPKVCEKLKSQKKSRLDGKSSKIKESNRDENSSQAISSDVQNHADKLKLVPLSTRDECHPPSEGEYKSARNSSEKSLSEVPLNSERKMSSESENSDQENVATTESYHTVYEENVTKENIESKNIQDNEKANDRTNIEVTNVRKSGTIERQGNTRKTVNKTQKTPSKEVSRRSRCSRNKTSRRASPRTNIDLTSDSEDTESEDRISESQNKSKIVRSVFGRVFGGEKTDKVKEVLNDWVSKSEDDSDASGAGFASACPNEPSNSSHLRSKESNESRNEEQRERSKKRHSTSSSSVSSGAKKRPGRKPKKNGSSSTDRVKENDSTSENHEHHRTSGKHTKPTPSNSKNRRKYESETANNHISSPSRSNESHQKTPTSRCRQSKKRAEERISKALEYEWGASHEDGNTNKTQKSTKQQKEATYELRNQKDGNSGTCNYNDDTFKRSPCIMDLKTLLAIEQSKLKERMKSTVTKKGKKKHEKEDWKDLVIDTKQERATNELEDEETKVLTVKNHPGKEDQQLNRRNTTVDLESSMSRSCSSLAASSVRNRSPSLDRNSQTTRDSELEEGEEDREDETDIGNRRLPFDVLFPKPLFPCGTPEYLIESSWNSENEEDEEDEEEEEEEIMNHEEPRKRSSSEFSGEKIVIRSPSSTHKTEVVTIAPTDAIEDNALDVPQNIEISKPRQGKVLNFDEELFVECCSRLKATTENELRGAKKIKLDHIEAYHKKDDQQQGFRTTRDRWRDVESQNSLGSLLESVNQLLGEEMYSTRERDYPKRAGRNLRSEHSSRSASPDMSRADNLGYEDSLDVAFEHNNKLRDKIQQRMRESENLIASTFGQKAGQNDVVAHRPRNDDQEIYRNSYDQLQEQNPLSTNVTNGYNDTIHVRNPLEQQAKIHLDSTGFKSKMNSALGGLLDKALSNLLHSNGKHDHNGSTPMKVLAELACARAPTSTSTGDSTIQDDSKQKPISNCKETIQDPNPTCLPKDSQIKKVRNPIKELFERKKEMNERKQQEKSKAETALRDLNAHRQRKTKKTKKRQEFPLIRRNEHGGLAEKKKRRDGFERKEELGLSRIKDIYDFDEEESQMEPNLGPVMSYRSRTDKGYEVSCLRTTKDVDVAGLMSKAIGDTLENGKTSDALGTRLESMIDRKFKELEKFAPKTKGALKAFQSEEQRHVTTGPMDEFIERKQRTKRVIEQNLKHTKLKKRSKNPRKKARNAWYENDSSDEYRTAVKADDIGVGISKSQRTCSKGKQNLFAELSTSSESEFDDEDADYENKKQRRVKKSAKKIIDLEDVEQSHESTDKFHLDCNDQLDEWDRDQDLKNDSKNDCDNKKSESEMSDHPLVIDERKDMDDQRNSDDETENPYERNYALDDLYREDSSVAASDVEEPITTENRNIPEKLGTKSPSLARDKNSDEKTEYIQEHELIPLEEALDLLDQPNTTLGMKYEKVNKELKNDADTITIAAESVDETPFEQLEESEEKCPTPIEEQEDEPDDDLPALPEKLTSNEKPQKESENLPLHVFLSRKVQESKKRKEQQLKKLQEEQERILMAFQPTRRQRKCAIGKQGLLAEISSSDEEICTKDTRRTGDKSDHEKPRKQKRESKEKRKERYIEKKHEQMIAKEQKAIEEEILREVGKKKETLTHNTSETRLETTNAKKQESTESSDNGLDQTTEVQKKRQTKEKQKKSSKDEEITVKNNNEALSDLENNCNKSTHSFETSETNNVSSPTKQKKHSKSPVRPKKVSKETKAAVPNRKSKSQNVEKIKSRTSSVNGKDGKERRSSSGRRDSDDEELKTTKSWNKVEEGVGVAIGRRKRAAANQLYYWSSSSDEEEMLEVVPAVEEEEDDRQEQHGWIVGDSHKRMITMLAMEKQLKEKRRRSEDEFEPGRTKSKKHRNSTS